ncbi:MAG: beta strand repeat-containing protein, partial [Methylobacter sp.]
MKTYRKKQSAHHESFFRTNLPLRRALNLAILAALYPSFSYANPDGAQIVSGQVSINTATPGVTTVTNSPNAIINWQNFSIAQNELTQFIQQNGQSAVLNRIIGQNPSEILGQLTSNGKVFLINPNGIVFGAGAVVDTQGLIASSLNLNDQDFLSGNYHFIAGSGAGNIVNEGIIRAGKDGNIILIAPQIENNGIIKSDGGSITLAAGHELTITNLDDPEIRFQIQAPADSVVNLGQLLTEGGAINVFAGTIKHSGEINADSVEVDKQGNIRLVAQQDITLDADSKISANNSQGDAGAIHIDSKTGTTLVQGAIEAQATQTGKGGKVELLGEQVEVLDQARIDASGKNGGGQVLIGGDFQGKNLAIHNAKTTFIDQNTTIKADARTNGDGGKVIVWSNKNTRVHGNITAQGGSRGGNGGFIETSGAHIKIADTARISTLAPYGKTGTWLIDPNDFTIAASGGDMTGAALSTSLDSNSITIQTSTMGTSGGNGDIFVNDSIAKTGLIDTALTLAAERSIVINAPISSTNSKLDVTLQARATDAASGNVWIKNNITTHDGNLLVGGGSDPSQGAAIGYNATGTVDQRNGIYINNATISTGAGNITMHGRGVDDAGGESDGISLSDYTAILETTTGNIQLKGQAGSNSTTATSGVYIGGYVQSLSGGSITIKGNGGNTSSTVSNRGVYVNYGTINANGGPLSIIGTGGNGTGTTNYGVLTNNSTITTTADLTITATGNGSAGDLMQSGGIISNRTDYNYATGNSDVTLSGNNLTITDARSQRHIILNALGDVNLGLLTTNFVDDQYFTYNLPFAFTFFGTSYSQAYISSNGLITFGNGTSAYIDSTAALASYKAIAPAWNDWVLHPSSGQNILISRPTSSDLAVKWDVERYYNTGKTAVFEAVLNSSGNITFNYGATNDSFAGDVTIGLSDGTSAISSQLMTNFTSLNNLTSTTFTPYNDTYTETTANSGGTLVSTTPIYTGTTGSGSAGFITFTGNTILSAASNVTVTAGGSITQNGIIASGTDGNIVLAAGGNYVNNAGSNALNVSGNGRWLVYSTNPNDNTLSGLAATFKHYGCGYGGAGCADTSYLIPSTGNGLLYSTIPVLTVTPGTADSVYGSLPNLEGLAYTLSGYIDGDTEASTNITGTASFSTDATTSSSVGNHNISYNDGLSNSLGYVISDNTTHVAEHRITPYIVNLTGSRVYNGTQNIFAEALTIDSLANNETLTLTGIGSLYSKDVGTGKTISLGSLTLGDGTGFASNYTFTGGTQTVDITAANLTLSTNSVTKTYDGTVTAAGTAKVAGGTLFSGDSLSGGSFAFTDKNAGTNKTVTVTGIMVYDGNNGSNYNVSYVDNNTSSINAANLTLSTDSVTKTYDGTVTAAGAAKVTGGTLYNGDSLSGGSFAFTDKNAGNNKTVTTTDVTVNDGNNGGNYNVSYANNTTSTINAANLTLSTASVTKTYDSTVTAAGAAKVTNGTLYNGDSLSGGSFLFTDKNAGTNKTVTATDIMVNDGNSGGNYNVSYADNTTSTIDSANITVSTDSVTKTYDGTVTAAGTAKVTGGTLYNGDSLSGGSFAFTDKNAGTDKTVTTTGI